MVLWSAPTNVWQQGQRDPPKEWGKTKHRPKTLVCLDAEFSTFLVEPTWRSVPAELALGTLALSAVAIGASDFWPAALQAAWPSWLGPPLASACALVSLLLPLSARYFARRAPFLAMREFVESRVRHFRSDYSDRQATGERPRYWSLPRQIGICFVDLETGKEQHTFFNVDFDEYAPSTHYTRSALIPPEYEELSPEGKKQAADMYQRLSNLPVWTTTLAPGARARFGIFPHQPLHRSGLPTGTPKHAILRLQHIHRLMREDKAVKSRSISAEEAYELLQSLASEGMLLCKGTEDSSVLSNLSGIVCKPNIKFVETVDIEMLNVPFSGLTGSAKLHQTFVAVRAHLQASPESAPELAAWVDSWAHDETMAHNSMFDALMTLAVALHGPECLAAFAQRELGVEITPAELLTRAAGSGYPKKQLVKWSDKMKAEGKRVRHWHSLGHWTQRAEDCEIFVQPMLDAIFAGSGGVELATISELKAVAERALAEDGTFQAVTAGASSKLGVLMFWCAMMSAHRVDVKARKEEEAKNAAAS
eukprot:TRINITY_DN2642_c0_g1_i1.p1 TRINITY_DN2642_c0_g1~~TRINITY_DN2642_c0_g1_i1.p1  ORF type:complete len:534 (-),score=110.82 TRINITY_DN2642_c0_g1_i1:24-1625(-)